MSHNMLLFISGQMREYPAAAHSIAQFIKDLKKTLQVNVFVLLNTWDHSYSNFPDGVRSFKADVDAVVNDAHDMIMGLKMQGLVTNFAICRNADIEAHSSTCHLDTFEQFNKVAFMLEQGYYEMVKLEQCNRVKFDSIVKFRPDMMIRLDHVYSQAFQEGKLAKPYEVKVPGGVIPFHTIEEAVRSYTDFIEIFGRNAFRAYCSSLIHLEQQHRHDTPVLRGSLHLWMYKHLMDYGITISTQDVIYTKQAIIRPTHRFLTTDYIDFQDTSEHTFIRLAKLEEEWVKASKDESKYEEYLKMFDERGIGYDKD